MIKALSLQQIADYMGATLIGSSIDINRISTDTRQILTGDLFVALRGENYDAHNFLAQAKDAGACALVLEKESSDIHLPQLLVADTTRALGAIAALIRSQFDGVVAAITGSCGKTTVKEMLAEILSTHGKVHATKGNFNNHIGMPLTLFNLSADDKFAVLEMGASAGGEIDYLVQLARPHIALVNNVMPAHVEGFGSVDAIARAKAEIYQGLNESGVAIINLDDSYASEMMCELPTQNKLTFSVFNSSADVYAKNIQQQSQGTIFSLCTPNGQCEVTLHVIGRHNLANGLAASCCAIAAGASLSSIAAGLDRFKAVDGRLNIEEGVAGCIVVDDSYNANPGSVCAAIDAVKNIPGNKILVLGDMAELGSEAESSHKMIGEYAQTAGFQHLYSAGILSRDAVDSFGINAEAFNDKDSLVEKLITQVSKETVVLIKGSRSARMEVVAQALTSKNGAQQ